MHGRGEGKKENTLTAHAQKSVNFVFFRNSSVHSNFTYVQMRNINDVIDSCLHNGVSSVPSASSNASLKKTDLEG